MILEQNAQFSNETWSREYISSTLCCQVLECFRVTYQNFAEKKVEQLQNFKICWKSWSSVQIHRFSWNFGFKSFVEPRSWYQLQNFKKKKAHLSTSNENIILKKKVGQLQNFKKKSYLSAMLLAAKLTTLRLLWPTNFALK